MKNATYAVELTCGYAEWWRYNIYLSVAEMDADDRLTDYRSVVDRIYDIEEGSGGEVRKAPAGFEATPRTVSLETGVCDHIVIYLYVIANTFPASAKISNSPPFPMNFTVRHTPEGSPRETTEIFSHIYEVNQWGGVTVGGLRVPKEGDER